MMAIIVPIGIDFCGSAKSPDRFEPAIIPARYKGRLAKEISERKCKLADVAF